MTHTAVVRRVSRLETQISSLFSCVSCSLHQVKLVNGLFSTVLFLAAASSFKSGMLLGVYYWKLSRSPPASPFQNVLISAQI